MFDYYYCYYYIGLVTEIVHACCRLHNFCIDLRVPLIHKEATQLPASAARDPITGVLVDDQWRINELGFNATESQHRQSGNAVANEIVRVIEENAYAAIQHHHHHITK